MHALRGTSVKSDIMKIEFENRFRPIYGTQITWGMLCDNVQTIQSWRNWFRNIFRYAV